MRTATALFATLAATVAAHAADVPERTLQPTARYRLPGALAEISGLAPATETSVFAHGDEQAVVFQLDLRSGEIIRSISIGRPPITGDFESITAHEGGLFVMTSDGRLYEAQIGAGRWAKRLRTTETGVGSECEVEGIAPAAGGLLIVCKRSKGRLVIKEWSPTGKLRKIVDLKLKSAVPNPKEFKAADLARDPGTGALLVLDSSAGAILEVSASGAAAAYWRLGGAHPQAEGLALMPDGRIVVADEAQTGGGAVTPSTLTVYPPRR